MKPEAVKEMALRAEKFRNQHKQDFPDFGAKTIELMCDAIRHVRQLGVRHYGFILNNSDYLAFSVWTQSQASYPKEGALDEFCGCPIEQSRDDRPSYLVCGDRDLNVVLV